MTLDLLNEIYFKASSELISGAERYAGAHSYTTSKGSFDHLSIFLILFSLLCVFIVICAFEYKKEKNKDRY